MDGIIFAWENQRKESAVNHLPPWPLRSHPPLPSLFQAAAIQHGLPERPPVAMKPRSPEQHCLLFHLTALSPSLWLPWDHSTITQNTMSTELSARSVIQNSEEPYLPQDKP